MSTKLCTASDTSIPWQQIDFKKADRRVKKLQKRIALAYGDNEMDKVVSLQHKMIHSFYAKALAVKRVTSNKGNHTPGIDGVVWLTPEEKMEAVFSLNRRGYKPKPLKRVYIRKSNGNWRPLGIPTFKDRAMQTLYKFALEPIAEATADNGSYGFRWKRSVGDAVMACATTLSASPDLQWILKADIQSCFDNISHEWILNHIPMDKEILWKILNCGFVSQEEYYPSDKGIPQGGCLSSVICNMALDGLEGILTEQCESICFIRYADDFIVIGPSREILVQSIVLAIQKFLSERGLFLSYEKTIITKVQNGFSFLGYEVYWQEGKVYLIPARKSIDSLLHTVYGLMPFYGTRQEEAYEPLKHAIRGWMNYYAGIAVPQSLLSAEAEILSLLISLAGDKRTVEFIEKIFSSYDKYSWETKEG